MTSSDLHLSEFPSASDALQDILSAADAVELHDIPVLLHGADPVLATRFRVGTAGAAAIAAAGQAAAHLWRLRSGQIQTVQVDLRAATASLRSSKYTQMDGKPLQREWDPLAGFYDVQDARMIFLHTNFLNLRDAATVILKAEPNRASIAASCRRWRGEELETALQEGGGCAAFVRTPEEWSAHPHAHAIQDVPIVEILRIGDAQPEPLPQAARPLDGIRVLDATRVIAGPTCARTLAEHGADVLKVTRADLPHSGWLELDTGIGKRSTHLDLRNAADSETLRALLRRADVFSQSYRPGTLAARGLSPADVAAIRPGIVYVTLSAWSHLGPWSSRRGYDTVVQAATGMSTVSAKDGVPEHLPVSAIDYVSGNLMAFGSMIALARRAEVGGSWLVRVSLATTGRWIRDLGLLPTTSLTSCPDEIASEVLQSLFTSTRTQFGELRHLAPIAQLSVTPGHWERPPVSLGSDAPVWSNQDAVRTLGEHA